MVGQGLEMENFAVISIQVLLNINHTLFCVDRKEHHGLWPGAFNNQEREKPRKETEEWPVK